RVGARLARRRLIKTEIGSDGRRVAGERDVVESEPGARLVDDPLAGHDPDLADARRRRGRWSRWSRRGGRAVRQPADRIGAARPPGQVVFVDDRLGGRDRYRVDRDQGGGGRGEDRAVRRPAGGAALPDPPLPEQPQVLLTVKPGHASMLAQNGYADPCRPVRDNLE